MNWITQHLDAVLLAFGLLVAFCAYQMGVEIGYREGLEDGFKDGQLNA